MFSATKNPRHGKHAEAAVTADIKLRCPRQPAAKCRRYKTKVPVPLSYWLAIGNLYNSPFGGIGQHTSLIAHQISFAGGFRGQNSARGAASAGLDPARSRKRHGIAAKPHLPHRDRTAIACSGNAGPPGGGAWTFSLFSAATAFAIRGARGATGAVSCVRIDIGIWGEGHFL